MASITGIGGIFYKVEDREATRTWYRDHLGIETSDHGSWSFHWRDYDDPNTDGQTEWSPFPRMTDYFDPSDASFMINYRVDDLNGRFEQLKAAGIEQIGEV